MTEATSTAPALGVSLKAGIGDGKELVFQTHIDQNTDAGALNALLDKLRVAADRQGAFTDLVQLRQAHEQHLDSIENMDRQASEVEEAASSAWKASGKRGEPRLAPAEVKQKKQFSDTRQKFVDMTKKIEAQIVAAEAKIAGG